MVPVPDPALSRLQVELALSTVTEVVALAEELLLLAPVRTDCELDSLPSASRALRVVWRRVEEVLRYSGPDETHLYQGRDLALLLLSLRRADEIIRKAELDRFARRVSAVGDGLAGLDGIGSVEQLWNACSRTVCQLGFDRGIVSLVVDMVWTPKSGHSDREAAWTPAARRVGKEFTEEYQLVTPRVRSCAKSEIHPGDGRPAEIRALRGGDPRLALAVLRGSQDSSEWQPCRIHPW